MLSEKVSKFCVGLCKYKENKRCSDYVIKEVIV